MLNKRNTFLALLASGCLLSSGFATSAGGQPAAAAPAPAAPQISLQPQAAAPQLSLEQLMEAYGWYVGRQVALRELGFSDAEVSALVRGMKMARDGKEAPQKMEVVQQQLQPLFLAREQEWNAAQARQGKAEQAAYFAEVDRRPGVTRTPSGLRFETLQAGAGDAPTATSTVRVHYTGTLINGTVFDSSVQRGQPAEFALSQVIPGWTEGIQQMKKGGKIRLHIPSDLAYGDAGRPGSIPPAAGLVFEVELLDILPAPPAPGAAPVQPK